MKLSALIRKKEVATVTVATCATVGPVYPSCVATVASVNVANEKMERSGRDCQASPKLVETFSEVETLLNQQRETRREKALAMLEAAPETLRGIYADTDSDPFDVILAVAIRHHATCEMKIPKTIYDPFLLIGLIQQLSKTTH